jgi:hypothetical protein
MRPGDLTAAMSWMKIVTSTRSLVFFFFFFFLSALQTMARVHFRAVSLLVFVCVHRVGNFVFPGDRL